MKCNTCKSEVELGPTGKLIIDGCPITSANGLNRECLSANPEDCAVVILGASIEEPKPRRDRLTDADILAQLE